MDGIVVFAGWNFEGYGNLIVLENGLYTTYYAHLLTFHVQMSDWVTTGQEIGLSGNTGNSGGPHLHYEVRLNAKPEDPTRYYGRKLMHLR